MAPEGGEHAGVVVGPPQVVLVRGDGQPLHLAVEGGEHQRPPRPRPRPRPLAAGRNKLDNFTPSFQVPGWLVKSWSSAKLNEDVCFMFHIWKRK